MLDVTVAKRLFLGVGKMNLSKLFLYFAELV